jgi:hypothetical protein
MAVAGALAYHGPTGAIAPRDRAGRRVRGGAAPRRPEQARVDPPLYRAPVDDGQLLDLLWAANGVNRPDVDGRTAPSWRTAKDTEIYVARPAGVDRFDAPQNRLVPVAAADIRKLASTQPFVGNAPVELIYLSQRSRILQAAGLDGQAFGSETEDHRIAAHVNAAVIAQNVYLFCAEGLKLDSTAPWPGKLSRGCIVSSLSNSENVDAGPAQHVLGDASKEYPLQTRSPLGSDHNELRLLEPSALVDEIGR